MAAYLICIGACVCLGLTYGVLLSGAFRPKADVFNMIWPIPVMAGVLAGTALYVLRPEGLTTLRRVGLAASAVLVLQALPYAQLQPHPDSLPPRNPDPETRNLDSASPLGSCISVRDLPGGKGIGAFVWHQICCIQGPNRSLPGLGSRGRNTWSMT